MFTGRAARYELMRSRRPIRDGHLRGVTVVRPLLRPASPGTGQRIIIRRPRGGPRYYAIRAIDHAGNIGRLAARSSRHARG